MVLSLKSRHISKYENFARIGFFFYCVSAMFSDLITSVMGEKSIYLFFCTAFSFLFLASLRKGTFRIKKKTLIMIAVWIAFLVVFVVGHNQQIAHKSYFAAFRWIYFFSMIPLLSTFPKQWYHGLLKILGSLTLINVFFVFFFLIFSGKYHIMFSIWGYWPTGTQSGMSGYRAGIASHYSENAMILAVGMMTTASLFIANFKRDSKKSEQKRNLIFILLFLFCIILTAKRAHLLFGVTAILFGYLLYKPEQRKKNFIRVITFASVMLVLFVIVARYVPAVGYIYERFTTMGEDEESNTRFEMWNLALSNFKKHPVFGIGWAGFKYEFHEHLYRPGVRSERYAYLNAHNVYIQLLTECGIVGFIMYFSNALYIFFKTVMLFKKRLLRYTYEYGAAVFSVVFQMFFYMYCFTGNCIYDMMFSYYTIAVGISLGLSNQKRIM